MLKRVLAAVLAVLALFAVTGFAPGDSTQATVEHCYVDLNEHTTEDRETRCTGQWSRFGVRFTGEVYGVDVPWAWQAIPPNPRADGTDEVAVAETAKHQTAVAIPGAATVTPWLVWTIRAVLALLACFALARLAHELRQRRGTRSTAEV